MSIRVLTQSGVGFGQAGALVLREWVASFPGPVVKTPKFVHNRLGRGNPAPRARANVLMARVKSPVWR